MKRKILNKTSRRVFAAGLMALSLMSVSIPSYAGEAAKAMPVKISTVKEGAVKGAVSTSVKVTTQGTYTDKAGDFEATIKTPKATGKVKGLDVLNQNMQAYTKKIKADYLKDKESAPEGRQSVTTRYKVLTNTKSTLSIRIHTTVAMGGSNSFSKYFTLDKATGKIQGLKDLFQKEANYITVISKNVIEQMNKIMDEDESKSYFVKREPADENVSEDFYFTKIKKNQEFYMDKKGNLVIAFDKYEAAPGYMGEVKFTIPKSVIEGILK